MKIIILSIGFLLIAGAVNISYAQLSKKEKKEWKKRKSKMSEEEFKTMFEENSDLRGQANSLKTQITNLQSRISDKDAKIAELTEEVRKLEQLAAAPPQLPTISSSDNYDQGVVFKVQIGAFAKQDLSKFFERHENFSGETDENGLQKVTLGVFRDYWEADTFKKHLREMGVRDAWIVPYKDGVRVPMKDVLEGVI